MRRRNRKGRPSKAACDAYRRLVTDDSSRLEKGGIDLETLPAIDLDTLPEIDLTLPEVALDAGTGEEPTP
ncbi:hypothetical protein [Halomonas chromatireducens]|uniref:Uncharacterized protein n=1 Tax=Halomonas chromatireducens TaxID=507626 RepID=A0A0X8HB51_9GAMM|nr:hypothetical protein [Halomonas chromatireducens]AMC99355.1 hypothetical protein LOKO_00259 [Halomonas chromatireducens]